MKKLFIICIVCASLIPVMNYAADDSTDSLNTAYQSCVDDWTKGLTKDNPDIEATDIKYVAAYYCLCAYDIFVADSTPTPSSEADKQKETFKQCMPYAVLRNTLHYDVRSDTGERVTASSDALKDACKAAFPNSGHSNSGTELIGKFCSCAAEPLTKVQAKKADLTEEQIKSQVMTIAKDCANNNDDDSE